jgi:hypothetical protein
MKRLITLLLFAPALACAQFPFAGQFQITSGSPMTITPFDSQAGFSSFNAVGSTGSVASGGATFFFFSGLINPLVNAPFTGPIDFNLFAQSPQLGMEISVNGVDWSDGATSAVGADDSAQLSINTTIPPRPGIYSVPFGFGATFVGAPASEFRGPPECQFGECGCDVVSCQTVDFSGQGIAVFDVTPFPNVPGAVQVTQATFTFNAPEPSAFWLLLLGLAGLATVGGRRLHIARLA